MPFDLEAVRSRFPALAIEDDGVPRIYFDNPAGTQVPETVASAVADCLLYRNANIGGDFASSRAAREIVADARAAMADLLNAPSADEIIFGANMTSITLHVSRSVGRLLEPGDEIILSRMDHDANVWPWVLLARDLGLEIRWLPFDTDTFEFDLKHLDDLLGERTRLVCVGAASNLTGTINDVAAICGRARSAGAMTYIDAVQSVPHVATDVQQLGCDFLACSAYKFFGPHMGILWGRRETLERLEPYKVRPAPDDIPDSFETGTGNHEGCAGISAAVDYLAWIGQTMAAGPGLPRGQFDGRRQAVRAAMELVSARESRISAQLVERLLAIDGVTVQGITATDALDRRVPTVAFTHRSVAPATIARALGEANIFVWSGHNYAVEVARALGILESGGAVRVGAVHYNSPAEIDRCADALEAFLAAAAA